MLLMFSVMWHDFFYCFCPTSVCLWLDIGVFSRIFLCCPCNWPYGCCAVMLKITNWSELKTTTNRKSWPSASALDLYSGAKHLFSFPAGMLAIPYQGPSRVSSDHSASSSTISRSRSWPQPSEFFTIFLSIMQPHIFFNIIVVSTSHSRQLPA